MTIRDPFLFLKHSSQIYLNNWLLDGLLGTYISGNVDAFYPHSSFNGHGDPIISIRNAYRSSSAAVQHRLRSAVAASTQLVFRRAARSEIANIKTTDRIKLLSILGVLVCETGCVDGAVKLTEVAASEIDEWGDMETRKIAFATILRTLVELSTNSIFHSSSSGACH